ncbi:hypothetical protein SAMN04489806_2138 [Paramicrobacterium humi]|uniref:Glycosyl transferase family 2 n=1 Tax=Paramicrobacterium humi TaxID=640635 RepID=A0A1H4NB13_9MICO|nr:glycosyltransferase [Microbacterium humi]SEB92439.1 hypothetical protein SAMN04489806_2138 [Microbacterium humi]
MIPQALRTGSATDSVAPKNAVVHARASALPNARATVGCILTVSDAEATIASILETITTQFRVPDVIHVIVTGSTDGTARIAEAFAGSHISGGGRYELFVHELAADDAVDPVEYGRMLVEACEVVAEIHDNRLAPLAPEGAYRAAVSR